MHSQSALTEHVSPNLAGIFLLNPVCWLKPSVDFPPRFPWLLQSSGDDGSFFNANSFVLSEAEMLIGHCSHSRFGNQIEGIQTPLFDEEGTHTLVLKCILASHSHDWLFRAILHVSTELKGWSIKVTRCLYG